MKKMLIKRALAACVSIAETLPEALTGEEAKYLSVEFDNAQSMTEDAVSLLRTLNRLGEKERASVKLTAYDGEPMVLQKFRFRRCQCIRKPKSIEFEAKSLDAFVEDLLENVFRAACVFEDKKMCGAADHWMVRYAYRSQAYWEREYTEFDIAWTDFREHMKRADAADSTITGLSETNEVLGRVTSYNQKFAIEEKLKKLGASKEAWRLEYSWDLARRAAIEECNLDLWLKTIKMEEAREAERCSKEWTAGRRMSRDFSSVASRNSRRGSKSRAGF